MSELTDNERLISVLSAQCGNYGLTPKYSSFAAHAMVIGHFMEGGYYPKGGADQICKKTIKVLNDNGGKVFINADVKEIVTKNNRVKGVKIGDAFIPCSSVISNVGVNNTFNHLLSEEARKRCKFDLQKVKPSSGHMCLYVGLNKSDTALNLPRHNVWSFANDRFDEIIEQAELSKTAHNLHTFHFHQLKILNGKTKIREPQLFKRFL